MYRLLKNLLRMNEIDFLCKNIKISRSAQPQELTSKDEAIFRVEFVRFLIFSKYNPNFVSSSVKMYVVDNSLTHFHF